MVASAHNQLRPGSGRVSAPSATARWRNWTTANGLAPTRCAMIVRQLAGVIGIGTERGADESLERVSVELFESHPRRARVVEHRLAGERTRLRGGDDEQAVGVARDDVVHDLHRLAVSRVEVVEGDEQRPSRTGGGADDREHRETQPVAQPGREAPAVATSWPGSNASSGMRSAKCSTGPPRAWRRSNSQPCRSSSGRLSIVPTMSPIAPRKPRDGPGPRPATELGRGDEAAGEQDARRRISRSTVDLPTPDSPSRSTNRRLDSGRLAKFRSSATSTSPRPMTPSGSRSTPVARATARGAAAELRAVSSATRRSPASRAVGAVDRAGGRRPEPSRQSRTTTVGPASVFPTRRTPAADQRARRSSSG